MPRSHDFHFWFAPCSSLSRHGYDARNIYHPRASFEDKRMGMQKGLRSLVSRIGSNSTLHESWFEVKIRYRQGWLPPTSRQCSYAISASDIKRSWAKIKIYVVGHGWSPSAVEPRWEKMHAIKSRAHRRTSFCLSGLTHRFKSWSFELLFKEPPWHGIISINSTFFFFIGIRHDFQWIKQFG